MKRQVTLAIIVAILCVIALWRHHVDHSVANMTSTATPVEHAPRTDPRRVERASWRADRSGPRMRVRVIAGVAG